MGKKLRSSKRPGAGKIAAYSAFLTVASLFCSAGNAGAVTVIVDAGNIIRDDISAKTFASGVQHDTAQFNQLMGSTETPNTTGRGMVTNLGLGMMRFPSGTSAQHYFWDHISSSYTPNGTPPGAFITLQPQIVTEGTATKHYDGMYSYMAGLGMDPLLEVNTFAYYSSGTAYINKYGTSGTQIPDIDPAGLTTAATSAGNWVANYQTWLAGHSTPTNQFWEVGNEDWSWWQAEQYAKIFAQFATSMKAQKSDIKLLAQTISIPYNPIGSTPAAPIVNDINWTTKFATQLATDGADLKSVYALSYHKYFSSPNKPVALDNYSFETPNLTGVTNLTACNSSALLSTSSWTFTSVSGWSAGLTRIGTGNVWGNSASGFGSQSALIQGTAKMTYAPTNPLVLNSGIAYTINIKAAKRSTNVGTQAITVKINGASIGTITPTTTAFGQYSLPFTVSVDGAITLSLEGTATTDATAFMDDITIMDRTQNQYRHDQTQDIFSTISQASDLNALIAKVNTVNSTYNVGWKIWCTEFNLQQPDANSTIGITNAQDVGQGMVIADWTGKLLELGVERMSMHSLDQHPCFSLIEYANNGGTPTAPFMSVPGNAYSIYPQKFGAAMLKVSYTGNPLIVNNTPQISTYASLTADRTQLRMIVVNHDLDNAVPLTIQANNAAMTLAGATYQQLTSTNVWDNNSNHTNSIAWTTAATFTNGQNVPAHSITYVQIPVSSVTAQPTNFSFENPSLRSGTTTSSGTGWTFQTGTGWGSASIAANGSVWNNPQAPNGTQVAVIQANASISQNLTWKTNTNYWITVSAAQRASNSQTVSVSVGGTAIGTIQPAADGVFHTVVLGPFTTANGSLALKFQGTNPGVDVTQFLDNIKISAVTNGGSYLLAPACAPTARLDVYQAGTTNATNVDIYHDNNTLAQRWILTNISGNTYELTPSHASTMRLDDSGAGTANHTNVDIYTSNSTSAQRWILKPVTGGFTLSPVCAPATYLNVLGSGTTDATNVDISTVSSPSAQTWNLISG